MDVLRKPALLLMSVMVWALLAGCSDENTGLALNGTWHVEENSQLYGIQHYDTRITQIDSAKIEINNFYNIGSASYVTATVNGLEIAISGQKVGGYVFSGSGEISADYNSIIFTFTANDGAVVDHAIAQYKR
jgi:hypothetical protein